MLTNEVVKLRNAAEHKSNFTEPSASTEDTLMSAKWLLVRRRKVDSRLRPNATSTGWEAPVNPGGTEAKCSLGLVSFKAERKATQLCTGAQSKTKSHPNANGLGMSHCGVLGPSTLGVHVIGGVPSPIS